MGVLTCAYCHHPVSEHYGRWCRVRTGAVNILGQELICCCQGADSVATRMTTECLDCAIDWHDVCADRRHDDDRDGCCCGRIAGDDEGEA